jgi:hypothetical protein
MREEENELTPRRGPGLPPFSIVGPDSLGIDPELSCDGEHETAYEHTLGQLVEPLGLEQFEEVAPDPRVVTESLKR